MVTTATESLEPAERLRRARHDLVATLAHAADRPQAVTSATPIRALPDDVGAVVVARAQAGLTPAGPEFPRQVLLRRVATPSAALSVLDLVLLVVALIRGDAALAIVAAVLLVVFASAAAGATRHAVADPLRVGPKQRRAIEGSGRWTPTRTWPEAGPERTLVAAASAAAQRIVDTPAWRHGVLARGGVVLSLGTELDLVEAQASTDDNRERLVTRVSALLAYAGVVESLDVDEETIEPEQDVVEVLAFFLSSAIYEVY